MGQMQRTSYHLAEAVQLEWSRRFSERLKHRLPGLLHADVPTIVSDWQQEVGDLQPEEAAEIAALRLLRSWPAAR